MKSILFGILVLLVIISSCSGVKPIKSTPQSKQIFLSEKIDDAQDSPVKRSCPNNCNNHGTCNSSNVCQCNSGWAGVDCSIALVPITNNTVVASSVSLHNWVIYTINAYSTSVITIELNQTTSGDADLYIRFNNIPTLNDFDYRDSSGKTKVKVTIDAGTRQGLWYIGVFGYLAVSFNIRVTVTGDTCNCNNHGTCRDGVCTCNSGYWGSDCSIAYSDLTANTAVSSSVGTGAWKYYRSVITSGNFIEWELTQIGQGDVDIYVQFNQPPTLTSYLYNNITMGLTSTIRVNDASIGSYFVGVYGFRSSEFRLVQDPVRSQCPNQCSKRGTCSGITCTCRSGFSGEYCQTMTAGVTTGLPYEGFVDQNLWNFYHYVSNTLSNLVITVNQEEASSDCDLYVKAGALPNRSSYDYFDASLSQTFSLTIPHADQNTWYIGVFGWKTCNYIIRYDISNSCPNNCNNHGLCTPQGVCDCEPGFSGLDCSKTADPLGNSRVVSGSVGNNEWAYYYFTLLQSESVYIQVRETSSVGEIGLYVSKDIPDLRNYEYASASTQEAVHRIAIHFTTETTVTYQIGVFGGPFIPTGRKNAFQIIAYSPDF